MLYFCILVLKLDVLSIFRYFVFRIYFGSSITVARANYTLWTVHTLVAGVIRSQYKNVTNKDSNII